ncbi:MAG TPA: NUDIX domain-containing protein [Verrucomicrobiae bacterium]
MTRRNRPKISAGLLLYRIKDGEPEVFLAHPGGPFFARKDNGHWTIPKGEPEEGEELLAAAQREFGEEVGFVPKGPFVELGTIMQKGGKTVHAWACEGDLPEGHVHSCNTFTTEWPYGSGRFQSFPEIDKVCFFPIAEARLKLKESQVPLLDRLLEHLRSKSI